MLGFRRQSAELSELRALSAAISKVQAVIEFNLDGTVITANANLLNALGYTLDEIRGKHHGLFVEPAYRDSEEYRRFWERLRAGQAESAQYKRLGKGGREVWIQASYNPLFDAAGKPYKVVKFATDVTAQVKATQAFDAAVRETQSVVQAVIDGSSDRRISLAGKTGQLEALSQSVNALVDSVVASVADTQQAVQGAIDGDLTRRIGLDGKTGHFLTLGRAINLLVENTMGVISQLQMTSMEVQSGSEEISRGNANLSQRTEEQASSLEETASSMEEMTSTIRQNADNAAQANQLALAARSAAEAGGAVVSQAVEAMRGINAASSKIADIIGVIDTIAFQTNLLALNAAVEAARAGEQGRGFAVVATEVRSLASRSAEAAKEIKGLINDSVARVSEGSKLVDRSGQTLQEIVVAVKKVTDIVAEISGASQEQAAGIDQVNKAVTSMDETTQQNAALVEEASAAARALMEQATKLKELTQRYRVENSASAAAALRPHAGPRPPAKPAAGERPSGARPWARRNAATPPARAAARTAAPASAAANGGASAGGSAAANAESDWSEF
jgi:methyl-accepting chemotaxis protein